jgi:single-stranded-DNA-specific exonuclease
MGKGSGRSIKGMNLVDALDYCKDILVRFGGHELAAGLTVMRCNIDEFKKRINDYAREHLTDDLSCIRFVADCVLEAEDVSLTLANEICALEPFGVANPTPIFRINGLTLNKIISMGSGKHSKLLLKYGDLSLQAVCFGMPASSLDFYSGEELDLLCQINVNEYKGQSTVQLVAQDVALSTKCAEKYEQEKQRYHEICSGSPFFCDEDVLPSRGDVAEIYKLIRRENTDGFTTFSYRMLRSRVFDACNRNMNYIKLRFALDILCDMRVCDIKLTDEDRFEAEVCKNAAKTNIELSETYRNLCEQCGD